MFYQRIVKYQNSDTPYNYLLTVAKDNNITIVPTIEFYVSCGFLTKVNAIDLLLRVFTKQNILVPKPPFGIFARP